MNATTMIIGPGTTPEPAATRSAEVLGLRAEVDELRARLDGLAASHTQAVEALAGMMELIRGQGGAIAELLAHVRADVRAQIAAETRPDDDQSGDVAGD